MVPFGLKLGRYERIPSLVKFIKTCPNTIELKFIVTYNIILFKVVINKFMPKNSQITYFKPSWT